MRACSFDLETTNLNANFGIILCGVVKPFPSVRGQITKPIIFRGDDYPQWKYKRSNDFPVCQDIYNELMDYDIWIAHNGVRFDVPFLRTRLIKRKILLAQPKIIDPVRLARRFLKLGYNSLEAVGHHLGYSGKTKVDGQYWNRAALDGCRKSMDYIVEHCIADTILLENVANDLRTFVPKVNQFGSDT